MTQGPTSLPPAVPGGNWAAGWYDDPWFAGQQRYWDGSAWTTHVQAGAGWHAPAAPAAPYAPSSAAAPADPYVPSSAAAPADPYVPSSAAAPADPYVPSSAAADPYAATSPADPFAPRAAATDPFAPAHPAGDPYGPAARIADPYAPPWASGSGSAAGGWLGTDHGPPPSRRRRGPLLAAALVVVAVAAASITVASGAGERKRRATPPALAGPSAPTGPSTTIPPPVSSDPGAGVLSRLDVAQADVTPAYQVTLQQGGNLVTGQVTLDLCNGTYPSESLRTARRQVDLTDQPGRLWLSTEPVLYANAAATNQAFTELRARAASCPATVLPPPPGEAGLPSTKTTFTAPPDHAWAKTPGVDRLAYAFTSTDDQGNTSQSVAVYLRRGRIFEGVYFANPAQAQPSVAGKTTVADIVGVFEHRMAALPASVANGSVPVPPPTGSI